MDMVERIYRLKGMKHRAGTYFLNLHQSSHLMFYDGYT